MTEYISKQAFKEKYLACGWLPEMSGEEFDAFPAADVAPVRHGRWKNGGNGLYDTCTACGEEIYLAIPMNYCPECGALMDGKEDEHEAG